VQPSQIPLPFPRGTVKAKACQSNTLFLNCNLGTGVKSLQVLYCTEKMPKKPIHGTLGSCQQKVGRDPDSGIVPKLLKTRLRLGPRTNRTFVAEKKSDHQPVYDI